jgi:hypothetical protein
MKSLRGVFSTARIDFGIQKDYYYNLLKRVHKRLSTEKGSGLSLDEIILASADDVYEYILKPYSERYADNVSTIAELLGVSIEDYLK